MNRSWPLTKTLHGFEFGCMEVYAADEPGDKRKDVQTGWVGIDTPLHVVRVHVNKAGKVMVYVDDKLMVPIEINNLGFV